MSTLNSNELSDRENQMMRTSLLKQSDSLKG